jgi:predicted lipid-binding transport protein (Tim44 family)
MQRSMTPSAPQLGYGGSGVQQSQRSGGGFMSGLMGGLIGAGIGGLLLGHGFMGGGMGMLGFFGMLLQLFLLVVVVRLAYRWFTNRRTLAMAGGPNMFARTTMPDAGHGLGPVSGGAARPAGGLPPIAVTQADYQQFEQLLQGVQAAWSAHDLSGLQAMATPEMVSYFSEQSSVQVSRGVRNTVTDVRLESGDLSQAWTEQGREYATVAMRFSMIDATREASGRVVDGSASEHVTATEIWTFVRSRGGRWILSAIQQTR